MASKPFRIAHLSDLHLTATDDGRRSEPKLFGALQGMNIAFRGVLGSRAIQQADLLLVTGDVTDQGDIKTWGIFWDSISTYALSDRCLVVPGNHDVCCLGVRGVAKQKADVKADIEKAAKGLRKGRQPTRFPWARQVDPRVVIIGLDSCNAGNPTALTNAQGQLRFWQLDRLARLLRKHQAVPVKIVALHHSPNIPGEETEAKRRLAKLSMADRWGLEMPERDRQALRLLCIAQNVRLVVHGHVHRAEDRRVNGVRMIGCPASTQPLGGDGAARVQFYTYTVLGKGGRVRVRLHTISAARP